MTDVKDEIVSIRMKLVQQDTKITEQEAKLSEQEQNIATLTNVINYQLNTTVAALNATVEEVKDDVEERVKEVNDNVSSQNSLMAYQFAGTFAILGSLISFWHMAAHLRKMREPEVQRKIIAIMWMVPIYTVSSWLGLVFTEAHSYLSILKDIYESYAIYTFLSFLIAILGRGDRNAVIDKLAQQKDKLSSPIRFIPCRRKIVYATTRHKAEAVLDQCMIFTLQFVLLRPITTIAMVISDAIHESRWDPKYPQFYFMMIVNFSIFIAFTGLVRFYHLVKDDLSWCNPFHKFLCIKGVVFMTFWQGIVISFIAHAVYKQKDESLAAVSVSSESKYYSDSEFDATEWSKQAQSFLICLEMFLFAIVHCFVFPTDEWEPGYQEKMKRKIKAAFGDTLALKDFIRDVKLVMRSKKTSRGKGKREKVRQNEDDEDNSNDGDHNNRNLNGSALMMEDAEDPEDIDIDWIDGWSRIEQYIDLVESEDGLRERTESDVAEGSFGDLELRERISSIQKNGSTGTGTGTNSGKYGGGGEVV
eukprot:CAMPEP_0204641672 /NCGR_PEP_ID=MMETSP0717-20131115/51265_1 /ASSEMBLY_ACC=CAM_ASM_000666 /TAXON_ID=230516 /ORGANISM="Chaetoceros curvisetus" /LENGTH=530 /DNA_ID=CAMNT_0051662365 /DNA_START=286 /DNA_END=1878 /DNA_ORIENTATION=+